MYSPRERQRRTSFGVTGYGIATSTHTHIYIYITCFAVEIIKARLIQNKLASI
jgi:hypothetical protein